MINHTYIFLYADKSFFFIISLHEQFDLGMLNMQT